MLSELWQHRIGALTYRKNVKDVWPENDFLEHEVPIPGGGSTRMKLAMRETPTHASIPVTEVRSPDADRASLPLSRPRSMAIASRMFARWCQENFFAYMMQHFDIDGLIEYGAESIPGTLSIINPTWHNLDKAIRKPGNSSGNSRQNWLANPGEWQ